ncbi:MAG: LapA family protein [Rubricella sp.]
MFRALRIVLLALFALVLIVLAVANRDPVTIRLLPDQMAGILQIEQQVPLFLLMIVLGGGGFTLGYFWEYLREWKIRRAAARDRREKQKLEAEVEKLRKASGEDEDDVLALLQ